jgi:hypothetical protein
MDQTAPLKTMASSPTSDGPTERRAPGPERGPGLPVDRRTALAALLGLAWGSRALAQAPAPGQAPPSQAPQRQAPADPTGAAGGTAPGDWPKVVKAGAATISIYLPQVDSWDRHRLEAHAAVSIAATENDAPVFGVLSVLWDTQVDKGTRTVTLDGFRIARVRFPSAADKEVAYKKLLDENVPKRVRTIELDRLEAALATIEARGTGEKKPLRNDPPRIVFSTTPAILVPIDGAPAYRAVPNTLYTRVINTHPLVLKDAAGTHYLHLFDGWVTAAAVTGPWSVAQRPPADLSLIMQMVAKSATVDLLELADPTDAQNRPSLAKGPVPAVLVATEPTELIVTQGAPNYTPIDGTQLLYVSNTTGHVFKHLGDQQTYVLVSGRWFHAPGPDGPWTHVPGASLPPDFAKIPDDSPKENVKASVPGTPQAQEAVIANSIPETAAIKRSEVKLPPPTYDGGSPQLKPIEGTPLFYVVNSPYPVIQVSPTSYYALQNGVWFVAPTPQGFWEAATSVPPVIYSIPPASPLHYVTYVNVYRATPTVVYVGYTPGYYGTYVTDGVVVYGTGYVYPAWVDTVYYPAPVTYGYAVAPTYTPWTGWVMGFGFGLAFGAVTAGWAWGCYPSWGPYRGGYGAAVGRYGGAAAWGPGGWAATTGNVYHRWGDTAAVTRHSSGFNAWTGNAWAGSAGMSYNSRTGTIAAGQRSAVGNAYSGNWAAGSRATAVNPRTGQTVTAGRAAGGNVYSGTGGSAGYVRGESGGAARVGNDVYATHDGNVYRNTGSGWEQRSGSSWSGTSAPSSVNRDAQARSTGQTRVNNYQASGGASYSGGARAAGGGARGGGGGRRR